MRSSLSVPEILTPFAPREVSHVFSLSSAHAGPENVMKSSSQEQIELGIDLSRGENLLRRFDGV